MDIEAIQAFCDKEVGAGCWSSPLLSSDLLPGMKLSPMFVDWQKNKPWVITNHSASGLNDGIPRYEAKVKYDDMHPFGQTLYEWLQHNHNCQSNLFKSDIASAFLNLPSHPLWKIWQIVILDEKLHIIQCLVFGNQASPQIWCSVSGLLCWIGIWKLNISSLHVYMDDFFGVDFEDNQVFYHDKLHP